MIWQKITHNEVPKLRTVKTPFGKDQEANGFTEAEWDKYQRDADERASDHIASLFPQNRIRIETMFRRYSQPIRRK